MSNQEIKEKTECNHTNIEIVYGLIEDREICKDCKTELLPSIKFIK